MALGVLSYPIISDVDYKNIQNFRESKDSLYYHVAKPHFSFVFPVEGISQSDFVTEMIKQTDGVQPFHFELKCAVINKDAFLDFYHMLLVPDQGFSDVVKLHDRLYSGLFFSYLRMDIDFIPHVGIANSKDKYEVKRWVDQWNRSAPVISGWVDKLMVVDYSDNVLTDLYEVNLSEMAK